MTSQSTSTALASCIAAHGAEETNALLLCVSQDLEKQLAESAQRSYNWLLTLCGALVFLMQLGFAMLCTGCVRRKNISNTMLKNILDTCGAAIGFWAVGFAFAFGGEKIVDGITFVGTSEFLLIGTTDLAHWFFSYACSAAAVTIIAGTLAERCRMAAYVTYSLFMTAWVYPVVAHSLWSRNGFLSPFAAEPFLGVGFIDFAGSGVVHLTGGMTALVAAKILGPRRGRFFNSKGEPLAKPRDIAGHSISLQVMGALTLWFGWYGFNAGAALLLPNSVKTGAVAALTAVNTSLSGAAGAITALLTNMYQENKKTGVRAFDLTKTMNGALTGLVAITASAGVLEPWAAVLVGSIAGWVYLGASSTIMRFKVDDAVDGIPVHCFGGAWGLISVGFLASPNRMMAAYGSAKHVGWFYSIGRASMDATLLANQILGLLFIVGWILALMFPFFWLLSRLDWLRIDVLEEIAGLDASYLHAKQEDHEDLKKNIREEFKKHKKEKQERALRSTMINTLEAGSSLEGQSVAISASSGHDGARSGSSEFRSISESSHQQKKDEPQLEQKQPKEEV